MSNWSRPINLRLRLWYDNFWSISLSIQDFPGSMLYGFMNFMDFYAADELLFDSTYSICFKVSMTTNITTERFLSQLFIQLNYKQYKVWDHRNGMLNFTKMSFILGHAPFSHSEGHGTNVRIKPWTSTGLLVSLRIFDSLWDLSWGLIYAQFWWLNVRYQSFDRV